MSAFPHHFLPLFWNPSRFCLSQRALFPSFSHPFASQVIWMGDSFFHIIFRPLFSSPLLSFPDVCLATSFTSSQKRFTSYVISSKKKRGGAWRELYLSWMQRERERERNEFGSTRDLWMQSEQKSREIQSRADRRGKMWLEVHANKEKQFLLGEEIMAEKRERKISGRATGRNLE